MSKKNRYFLFDLDGTLSESREKVGSDMGSLLRDLSKLGSIVIVSGCDYDFLCEQMNVAWSYIRCDSVILLPCNGTKRYEWEKKGFSSNFQLKESLTMKDHIGEQVYTDIISYILSQQLSFMKKGPVSLKCTGQFISYRGSMINWAPTGRNGNTIDREAFVKYDKETGYRKDELESLNQFLDVNGNVQASLGGDTSFDIFPTGWDKTIALRFFKDAHELYFFGDRCYPGGNDFEIYQEVKKTGTQAFSVSGPEDTKNHLIDLIKEIKKNDLAK